MEDSLKDFMETAGFGEMDRAVFENKDTYDEYFQYVQRAFFALLKHLEKAEKDTKEGQMTQKIMAYFLTRLLRSIEMINLNYRFDDTHDVRIDLTESSFPNHAEIRKVKADYNLKDDFLSQMPTLYSLKDKLLEHLRHSDEEPREILDSLSKQRYYHQLFPPSIFLMYNEGKLIRNLHKAASGRSNYVFSCAAYDQPTNRPLIYILTFEYSGEKEWLEDDLKTFETLKKNLEIVIQGARKLYDVMTFLDQELENIHPKLLRKFDVGPLFGAFSKDDHPLSKFYRNGSLTSDDFILCYEEEQVISSGEKEVKTKWLKSGTILQDFYVNKKDAECLERKVSAVNKYLLAPHKVVQMLNDDNEIKSALNEFRNNIIPV